MCTDRETKTPITCGFVFGQEYTTEPGDKLSSFFFSVNVDVDSRMSSQISTAATYNSRCARSMVNTFLQSLQKRHKPSSPSSILLFVLAPSSTTPPEVLSDIISTLTQLYPEHVGCISAPLPYHYFDPSIRSAPHSCSFAYAFVNGVSFRSTISGRAEAQVGRWHAARQRTEDADGAIRANIENSQMQIISDLSESDGKINWDDVWDRTTSSVMCSSSSRLGNGVDSDMLPDALRNLEYVFSFLTIFLCKCHVCQPINRKQYPLLL